MGRRNDDDGTRRGDGMEGKEGRGGEGRGGDVCVSGCGCVPRRERHPAARGQQRPGVRSGGGRVMQRGDGGERRGGVRMVCVSVSLCLCVSVPRRERHPAPRRDQ
eukprot:10439-Rhodomonas_salina.1